MTSCKSSLVKLLNAEVLTSIHFIKGNNVERMIHLLLISVQFSRNRAGGMKDHAHNYIHTLFHFYKSKTEIFLENVCFCKQIV